MMTWLLVALAIYLLVGLWVFFDGLRHGVLDAVSAFWLAVVWPIIAIILLVMAFGWVGRELRHWSRKILGWRTK